MRQNEIDAPTIPRSSGDQTKIFPFDAIFREKTVSPKSLNQSDLVPARLQMQASSSPSNPRRKQSAEGYTYFTKDLELQAQRLDLGSLDQFDTDYEKILYLKQKMKESR